MIGLIAHKEWLEMTRDGRFRAAAAIVSALLLISLATGWTYHRDMRAQHEAAARTARSHWLTQPAKNPHSAAHYGIYAFKPQLPLSFLDRGVDPYTGVTVWLEAHRQNDFLYRPAQDGTAAQRFGNLTAATVLQLILPLLIILLAFGAFAAEREQGTLRQVLSLGVRRTDLALGKAIGVAAGLGALLVPAVIVGAAALALGNDLVPATLPRATLLALAYLAYFAVFLAVAIAASAYARSSRAALVGLLGFWILNGLVAPRLTADVARTLHPTPSAFEFAQRVKHQLENGIDGHDPTDQRYARLEREVIARFGVARVEELPVNFDGIRLQEGEEYGNKVFDKNYGELWDTFERQSRVHEAAGVVAPMLAIRSLSMGLAGTDFEQHRHFAVAAEQYRRKLVKAMNDDMTVNSRSGDFDYMADARLWERMEDFQYTAPDAAWVLGNKTLSIAVLLIWLIGAALVAGRAARRAPVE
jgi:ABC-2 type transport system permease protein